MKKIYQIIGIYLILIIVTVIIMTSLVSSDTTFFSKDSETIITKDNYKINKITETYIEDAKYITKQSYEVVNTDISKDKKSYRLQDIVADLIESKPTTTTTSTTTTTKTEITKPISTTTTILKDIKD